MPIHLKEDLIVELALMHKYGIIAALSFSKYASLLFAKRKPNGKLGLLVDLRIINTLIAGEFTSNIHPVSTLSDATKTLGREISIPLARLLSVLSPFADGGLIVCRNACIQFCRQNLCLKRLAQGFNRSVFVSSSFMREYLEPVVEAD